MTRNAPRRPSKNAARPARRPAKGHGRGSRNQNIRLFGIIAAVAVVMMGLLIVAFSGSDPVEVSADTIILDVRSPEEYALGHLDGAQLLDLNSGQFQAVLPDLDPEAEYIVYCRSGNRSGQAAAMMADAGFENVTDLGTMQNASNATGIEIVR